MDLVRQRSIHPSGNNSSYGQNDDVLEDENKLQKSSLIEKKYPLISKADHEKDKDEDNDVKYLKGKKISNQSLLSSLSSSTTTNKRTKYDRYFYWSCVFIFTILGIGSRFYSISAGNIVSWDEAHFGKFGSYYLKRTFYSDLHPPLGKMLVGLAGYIVGYNGSFEFGSGSTYPEWVNYVGMRMFISLFGALIVPLSFMTAMELKLSPAASLFTAICVLFENGFICISRLILLDATLLFFTVASVFGLVMFIGCWDRPFTLKWYLSLIFTGFNIGCASSVKWVGLFVTALVGVHAARDLWVLLGDLQLSKRHFVRHLSARILFLIFLPISVYMCTFYIHFAILNRSGPGDGVMNSLFQAGLIGSPTSRASLYVSYGSKINLRNGALGGGMLHSHPSLYPEGSKQQQVTCYHHRDGNNDWMVHFPHQHPPVSEEEVRVLKHGDIIRLVHNLTDKNLHSHAIEAPIIKSDYEVSAYGNGSVFPDMNDHWIVDVVANHMNPQEQNDETKVIHSMFTEFRLRHQVLGCYLASSKAAYPDWGFKQQEVSCEKKKSDSKNQMWHVDFNEHPLLPPGNPQIYKSDFFDNFVEININMWRTNNALVGDPEFEPPMIVSYAWQWPFLLTGLRMVGWDEKLTRFLMLGNPIVWWGGIGALIVMILIVFGIILACHRGALHYNNKSIKWFLVQSQLCILGWMLHYLPFLIMGRVLYLHHYYPCLYFTILSVGVLFDRFLQFLPVLSEKSWTLKKKKIDEDVPTPSSNNNSSNDKSDGSVVVDGSKKVLSSGSQISRLNTLATLFVSIPVVYTFYLFMPTCYGMTGPLSNYEYLAWISTWNV